ncbi:MAG: hypothetical protein DMF61_25500 [Blastocatellia bacterium AA13]|nr:MAG: hypothetical protein DMF61_25500 [Blastocatellia bacterium AA13]
MIVDGYALYNPEKAAGRDDSKDALTRGPAVAGATDDPAQAGTFKSTRLQRRRSVTGTPERLRTERLAQTVGLIRVEPFSHRHVFDRFPKQEFGPNEVIPCRGVLCVIERGWVQIRHSRDKYLVKSLTIGGVFGEMREMGQTMLVTEAVAGSSGVTVTTMNPVQAWQWIAPDPRWVLKIIGARLYEIEADLHRIQCHNNESRVAALLLKLAGHTSVIEGLTQKRLGEMLGLHREVVATAVRDLRSCGAIATGLRKITVLDPVALQAISDLDRQPRGARRGVG